MKKSVCLLIGSYLVVLTITALLLVSGCSKTVGVNYPSIERLFPKVSIDKLIDAYMKDRVAADLIYKNKVVSSSGVVSFVGWETKLDRVFVHIVTRLSEKRLKYTLRCVLQKNHVKVRVGQKVIAQGTVVGYWSHLEFIRCKLIFMPR